MLTVSLLWRSRFSTISDMMTPLEADVALLHIAGHAARITPPPGTLAQAAPRRSARGRGDDLFFITLGTQAPSAAPQNLMDQLAHSAADAYYGTPGSVTSALREAAAMINDRVLDLNRDAYESTPLHLKAMIAIMRGEDLYVAQCGPGQAVLIRPGIVTRLSSDDASQHILGRSATPHVRYHHLELRSGDLFLLTTHAAAQWGDATLTGLSNLLPEQAIDRLVAASQEDLAGILARIVPSGESTQTVLEQPSSPQPGASHTPRAARRPEGAARFEGLRNVLQPVWTRITESALGFLSRMAPGIAEPQQPSALSPAMLAATAILVPIIVVAITAVVYFGKGRRSQYQSYLDQAQASIAAAQLAEDEQIIRQHYEQALQDLDLAENYDITNDSQNLREQAQTALDALNIVLRLNFSAIIPSGFGPDANITAIAASDTDIYLYDAEAQKIWHAWGNPGREYRIDTTFECLDGPGSFPRMDAPIDIEIQEEPGALGVEGVVAIDHDGTLLYCAPDRQPLMAELTPPDVGWRRITAIDVFADTLYVLDSAIDSVYLYSAAGGLFSGVPEFYFAEEVHDLNGSIDLALAQDELILLYADGQLDRCRRYEEYDPQGNPRIRVECDENPQFDDERAGFEPSAQIPGAIPIAMEYTPPPEPSLFFLDSLNNRVFHYSLRLVYQAQYMPQEPFPEDLTALTLGPLNDLYVAAGNQVYYAQTTR